jgi:hypothetical protein
MSDVRHLGGPQLYDVPHPVLYVRGSGFPLLHPHPGLHILYGAEVRRIARSLDHLDMGSLIELVGHNLGLVIGGSVLQKVCCLMLVHKKLQLLIQQLPVMDPVHHLALLEELPAP